MRDLVELNPEDQRCGSSMCRERIVNAVLDQTPDGEELVLNTDFVESMRRTAIDDRPATAIKMKEQHQPLLAAASPEKTVGLLGVISASDG